MPVELNCANCEQKFYCHPHEAEKGRKYCGVACRTAHLHKKGLSAASRTAVHFTCKECTKPFTMMQSYLGAYRKKFGRDPLYCSMDCSNTGRRKDADMRNRFTCAHCGKLEIRNRTTEKFRIYRDQRFCSTACKSAAQETTAFTRFSSGQYGRHTKKNGYVWISVPALANRGKKGAIMEHRYVMSQHLNRALYKGETVHHKNGNRQDNRIENLELFNDRHGPGQRVIDKVRFALEILALYPDFIELAKAPDPVHPKPPIAHESL